MPLDPTKPLTTWYRRLGPALVLYARQWCDAHEAEDAVQEVFVRMTKRIAPDDVRPWLHRAVRNEAISRARKRGARARRERAAAERSDGWFCVEPGARLDGRAAQAAIAALPMEEREVLVMRIWGELTLAEIAEIVGCSPPTAMRRHRSAIEKLRAVLGAGEEMTDARRTRSTRHAAR